MTDIIEWLRDRKYIEWHHCDVSGCTDCYIKGRRGGWWEFIGSLIPGGYDDNVRKNFIVWLINRGRK